MQEQVTNQTKASICRSARRGQGIWGIWGIWSWIWARTRIHPTRARIHWTDSTRVTEDQCIQVQALLNELREGHCPQMGNESMESSTDWSLNLLNYLNFPKLWRAHAKLAVKSKDPKLDVTFCCCITSMVGTLNLYLDPKLQYTWQEASLVVTKSMGTRIKNGSKQARNICTWIHNYLAQDRLPTHQHRQHLS